MYAVCTPIRRPGMPSVARFPQRLALDTPSARFLVWYRASGPGEHPNRGALPWLVPVWSVVVE